MKCKYIIWLFAFAIISCNNKINQSTTYFEGEINYEYECKYLGLDEETAEFLINDNRKVYGTRQTEYHKNGNFFRQYYTSGQSGLEYQIYRCKENKIYTKYNLNDTLYVSECIANQLHKNFKIISNETGTKEYNGSKCNYLETSYDSHSKDSDQIFTVKENYFYNDSYKLNPNNWINYRKSFVYETLKQMNSFPLYFERIVTVNKKDWTQIEKTKMTNTKHIKINDVKFQIDDNLPIVKR